MYQLKKGVESFEVVDGPMAGRQFFRGKAYKEIPPDEKDKFEEVKPVKPVETEKKIPQRGTRQDNGSTATERSKP